MRDSDVVVEIVEVDVNKWRWIDLEWPAVKESCYHLYLKDDPIPPVLTGGLRASKHLTKSATLVNGRGIPWLRIATTAGSACSRNVESKYSGQGPAVEPGPSGHLLQFK